jgi:hypothetical protein
MGNPAESRFLRRLWRLQFVLFGIVSVSTLLHDGRVYPAGLDAAADPAAPFSVLLAEVIVIHAILTKLTGRPPELAAPWPAWRNRLWAIGLALPWCVPLLTSQPPTISSCPPAPGGNPGVPVVETERFERNGSVDSRGNRVAALVSAPVLAVFLFVSVRSRP